jgi:hypothetical protein
MVCLTILFILVASADALIKSSLSRSGGYLATATQRLSAPPSSIVGPLRGSISEDVLEGAKLDPSLDVENTFRALMGNEEFVSDYWQKKPLYIQDALPNLVMAYTIQNVEDSVENDFVEAGRGTLDGGQGGWNMAAVSTPRGSTFEDAKLRFSDVQVALKKTSGTVVFNSAGGFIPPLAGVCLQTMNAFDLPVAINMYLTNPGQQLSAPPHTDKQDVFVLQTQGRKHWRVFKPPAPGAMPKADPYTRGKAKDVLKLEELEAPIIDTVLEPGQMLYVPGGFPHTTDTLSENCGDSSDPSVHLTIGIDTHIWGLTYAALRGYALRRKGHWDKLRLSRIEANDYFDLQEALPFGVLSEPIIARNSDLKGFGSGMEGAIRAEVKEEVVSKMLRIEGDRWADSAELEEDIGEQIDEAIKRLMKHHLSMVDTMKGMYKDVAFKISPSKMDISFFRSQPYFQQMEALMGGLEAWPEHGTDLSEAAPVETGPVSDLAAAKAKSKGSKEKSSAGGFGGGAKKGFGK